MATSWAKAFVFHGFRAFRLGSIGVVLFQTGYQRGIIDYVQDPHEMSGKFSQSLIQAQQGTAILPDWSDEHAQVSRVAQPGNGQWRTEY